MTQEPTSPRPAKGLSEAARYWDGNLDPQNLEPPQGTDRRMSVADEIRFAKTPDLAAAVKWLTGAPCQPTWIMDLGAGLGANSFALAESVPMIVAVDSSLARLHQLRERAAEAGCADRILLVVASAEALPFAETSVPAVYTRSVLIHTGLEASAAELAHVLQPGGRAALVEPQPGHPLVTLYRRLLAPKAWAAITRYFDPSAQSIFLKAIPGSSGRGRVRPFYFASFLAFVFQFGWPCLGLFKCLMALLYPIDRALFRLIPPLRRWAWFGMIELEKALTAPLRHEPDR